MRFAIFSDVHANRQAWAAVLADAQRQRVGTLVCLGDVVGYGPKPQEVLTSIRESTTNFVLGNHDAAACGRLDPSIFNDRAREVIEWTRERLDEESLEFLRQVPLQMDGPGLRFVHAEVVEPGEFGYIDGVGPAGPNLKALDVPLAFIGHTHLPTAFVMAKKGGPVTQKPPIDFKIERGKRYIINVGSAGEPRTTDVRASYVIYDDAEKTVNFRKVTFDVDAYVADLEETGLDIKPYFVRVVEAGKYSKPPPTAAPQLALTHLPKVTESVAGHHGNLVVGRPAGFGGPAGVPMVAGRSLGGVEQPKAIPPWLVVMLLVLLILGGVTVAVFTSGGEEDATTRTEDPGEPGSSLEVVRKPVMPSAARAEARAAPQPERTDWVDRSVPIKLLTVKIFPQRFESLEELRKAEKGGEEAEEQLVKDGWVSLGPAGGREEIGMVWEGRLAVPKTGDYVFTLDAAGGVALFLHREEHLRIGTAGAMGRGKSAKVRLAKGHTTPFRLEYFQKGGTAGLDLKWAGDGLDGAVSLVRAPSGEELARIPAERPERVDPKPAPEPEVAAPEAAAKLSQDLAAYWSFDARHEGPGRFTRNPEDGSVVERLVLADRSRVEVLVPKGAVPKNWREVSFDASDWAKGKNGVGYEDESGPLGGYIRTPVGNQPRRHPHSVFIRIPFTVDDPADYTSLVLQTRFTGGFVAYVNGRSTASANAPAPQSLRWNSEAAGRRTGPEILEWKTSPANSILKLGKLVKGKNVLAIHGLNFGGTPNATNTGCSSPIFLVQAELLALRPDDDGVPEETKPSKHDEVVEESSFDGLVKEVEGRFAEGYHFGNGRLKIGGKEKYAIGDGSFSVSTWFLRGKDSVDNQSRRLISAGGNSSAQGGWALYLSKKADAVSFVFGSGKQRDSIASRKVNLADGEWHHAVVSVDGRAKRVRVYLDGKEVASKGTKAFNSGSVAAGAALVIGGSTDAKHSHRGRMDDVAIWKRALAPEEVREIYKSEAGLTGLFNEEG